MNFTEKRREVELIDILKQEEEYKEIMKELSEELKTLLSNFKKNIPTEKFFFFFRKVFLAKYMRNRISIDTLRSGMQKLIDRENIIMREKQIQKLSGIVGVPQLRPTIYGNFQNRKRKRVHFQQAPIINTQKKRKTIQQAHSIFSPPFKNVNVHTVPFRLIQQPSPTTALNYAFFPKIPVYHPILPNLKKKTEIDYVKLPKLPKSPSNFMVNSVTSIDNEKEKTKEKELPNDVVEEKEENEMVEEKEENEESELVEDSEKEENNENDSNVEITEEKKKKIDVVWEFVEKSKGEFTYADVTKVLHDFNKNNPNHKQFNKQSYSCINRLESEKKVMRSGKGKSIKFWLNKNWKNDYVKKPKKGRRRKKKDPKKKKKKKKIVEEGSDDIRFKQFYSPKKKKEKRKESVVQVNLEDFWEDLGEGVSNYKDIWFDIDSTIPPLANKEAVVINRNSTNDDLDIQINEKNKEVPRKKKKKKNSSGSREFDENQDENEDEDEIFSVNDINSGKNDILESIKKIRNFKNDPYYKFDIFNNIKIEKPLEETKIYSTYKIITKDFTGSTKTYEKRLKVFNNRIDFVNKVVLNINHPSILVPEIYERDGSIFGKQGKKIMFLFHYYSNDQKNFLEFLEKIKDEKKKFVELVMFILKILGALKHTIINCLGYFKFTNVYFYFNPSKESFTDVKVEISPEIDNANKDFIINLILSWGEVVLNVCESVGEKEFGERIIKELKLYGNGNNKKFEIVNGVMKIMAETLKKFQVNHSVLGI